MGHKVYCAETVHNLPGYKKELFIKSGFLKLVVYIGCNNEIVLLLDKYQKIAVHIFSAII